VQQRYSTNKQKWTARTEKKKVGHVAIYLHCDSVATAMPNSAFADLHNQQQLAAERKQNSTQARRMTDNGGQQPTNSSRQRSTVHSHAAIFSQVTAESTLQQQQVGGPSLSTATATAPTAAE
jgi:type V secretory pathway adhesin AidA